MRSVNGNVTLEKLNEISFILNDLAVYLERNPSDERAADWYDTYSITRKELLEAVERESWRG